MQSPTADPRGHLAADAVVALIEDADSVVFGQGCELLDRELNVLDDLTGQMLLGGGVSRSNYANLHGTATLGFSEALDWGSAVVRPFMTMTDGTTAARFYLGAYFTSVPREVLGEDSMSFEVQCVDTLDALSDPIGDAYGVAAGANIADTIVDILVDRGYTSWVLDPTRADAVTSTTRSWAFDPAVTWLTVVNELLGSIGYQGAWTDWMGRVRLQTYLRPAERGPDWVYRFADPDRSMLYPVREREADLYSAPNRWVFYQGTATETDVPLEEGAGIFTYENQSEGQTSIEARGRTITVMDSLDATDQVALEQLAWSRIDADLGRKGRWTSSTFPNPLHWHFDRVLYDDSTRTAPIELIEASWSLPLDGQPMAHEWAEI